ncbi:MAG: CCA tRNA nucleotidyltransferase [Candidatus Doudnabacteria bacterium]|nr:CCA tRNA nucleotidyltransferase [Candidatus Doudnabacteria bacterium]
MELVDFGKYIAKLLKLNGFQVFFVGGCVRNILLNRPSDNLDIATDAPPNQVEKILRANKIPMRLVGKQFGTILANNNGLKVEITTFRKEGFYKDRRHPGSVVFTKDMKQDAIRRDFTINALYLDPQTHELFDPAKGIRDLRLGLIRFVGDPKDRIDEDSLRMLRAVRIGVQLGFNIEKNSFAAIKTRAKYVQYVSGERIKAELDKILSTDPRPGMDLLDHIGLLRFIIPDVEPLKQFSHQSKKYHLEGNMWEHTLLALDKAKKENLEVKYALLFHDIGKPQTAKKVLKKEGWVISTKGHADASAQIFLEFAKRIRFSKIDKNQVAWLVKNHMLMFDFFNMAIHKQLKLAESPAFPLLLKHWQYDEQATKRAVYRDDHHARYLKSLKVGKKILARIEASEPLIEKLANGDMIMRHSKLKPGPLLGRKIEQVKARIIENKLKTESDLKKFLWRSLRDLNP